MCAALAPAAVAGTPVARGFVAPVPTKVLTPGPDGAIWGSTGANVLVRIDQTGSASLTGGLGSSATTGITTTADGHIWFGDSANAFLGDYFPLVGFASSLSTGSVSAGAVATAADGRVWFTSDNSSPSSTDKYGRVKLDRSIETFSLPAGSNPGALAAGPDGSLFIAEPGTQQIAQIAIGNGTLVREYSLGISGAPVSIASGPDGNVWYGTATGRIGRLSLATGTADEFATGQSGQVTSITAGPDGNLWFVTAASNLVGRITPAGEVTRFATGVSGALCSIVTGPDANLWFNTCPPNAQFGRITTGEPPMRFRDPSLIRTPAFGDAGPASEYPAVLDVSGLQGTVTGLTVRLNGVHHSRASDLVAALVGPQGQATMLMANATSRVGDAGTPPDAYDGDVITFSATGRTPGRYLTTGVVKPFDPGFQVVFPSPAPAPLPTTAGTAAPPADLAVFNGTDPNGQWKLYLYDDEAGASAAGAIAGGWSLDVQTTGPTVNVPGPTVTVPGPTVTVERPAAAPLADTTAPALGFVKLPPSVPLATLRKGLKITVSANEAVRLEASLRAAVSRATIARGGRRAPSAFPLELDAVTTDAKAPGSTVLTLKPSATLLGRPRKAFTLELRVRGTDAAGNAANVSRKIVIAMSAGKPGAKARRGAGAAPR